MSKLNVNLTQKKLSVNINKTGPKGDEGEINPDNYDAKASLVDNDKVTGFDSEASDNPVTWLWSVIKSAIKGSANDVSEESDFTDESEFLFNIGGTIKRKVASGVLPYYNLKWFGATGDGVTDDTDAIKSAMAEVPNGQKLYAPAGEYLVTDTIVREDGIALWGDGSAGDGSGATRFKLGTGVNKNLFEFGNRVDNVSQNLNLHGFTARGTEISGDSYDLIQIWNRFRHAHIRDVFARACTGTCFKVDSDAGFTAPQNTYFYDNAAETANRGYDIDSSYNTRIINCYAGFSMADSALRVAQSNQVYIDRFWSLAGTGGASVIDIADSTIRQIDVTNCKLTEVTGTVIGSSFIRLNRPRSSVTEGSATISNNILGFGTVNEPTYGVRINSGVDNVIVHDNIFRAYSDRPIIDLDGSNKIYNNYNQKEHRFQSNEGTATIPDGSSSVVVNHNVWVRSASQLYVNATAQDNEQVWVDTVTTDQFTINRSGTSGVLGVFWNAKAKWS